jgi:radical SAM protein with 4Fe4S-binding SPASM domain
MDESCYDPIDGKVRCRAGKAAFWITWDGYMLPCGMMPEPKVDMYKVSFEDAWKQLTQKTENIRLSGICEKCSNRGICHSCAAMAYAETGGFQKVPIYLCEMMDAMKKIAEMELSNLE